MALLDLKMHAEYLVIDGGSDSTSQKVAKLACDFPQIRYFRSFNEKGKGDAVRLGVNHARGDLIVQFDADLQFAAEDIPKLIQVLKDDQADMVLGSRYTEGSHNQQNQHNLVRDLGNKLVSLLNSFLWGQKITDALAGLKAWKRVVTDSFELRSVHFSYEIELFAKAFAHSYRVLDCPVSYWDRNKGCSKVSVFKNGYQILRDSILFRFVYTKSRTL